MSDVDSSISFADFNSSCSPYRNHQFPGYESYQYPNDWRLYQCLRFRWTRCTRNRWNPCAYGVDSSPYWIMSLDVQIASISQLWSVIRTDTIALRGASSSTAAWSMSNPSQNQQGSQESSSSSYSTQICTRWLIDVHTSKGTYTPQLVWRRQKILSLSWKTNRKVHQICCRYKI